MKLPVMPLSGLWSRIFMKYLPISKKINPFLISRRFVFTRKFPFEIRPEFLKDVRRHIDTELTAEFGCGVRNVPILGIVSQ